MEKRQTILNKTILVLLIAIVAILSVFGGRYVPAAYADEIDSVQERYEQTIRITNSANRRSYLSLSFVTVIMRTSSRTTGFISMCIIRKTSLST